MINANKPPPVAPQNAMKSIKGLVGTNNRYGTCVAAPITYGKIPASIAIQIGNTNEKPIIKKANIAHKTLGMPNIDRINAKAPSAIAAILNIKNIITKPAPPVNRNNGRYKNINCRTAPAVAANMKIAVIIPAPDDQTFIFVIVNVGNSLEYINFIGVSIE